MTGLVEKNISSIVVQALTKQQKRKPRQKSEKPPRIDNHYQEPSKKKSCQERRQEITFCQEKTFVKKKPLSRRNRGKDEKEKEIFFCAAPMF